MLYCTGKVFCGSIRDNSDRPHNVKPAELRSCKLYCCVASSTLRPAVNNSLIDQAREYGIVIRRHTLFRQEAKIVPLQHSILFSNFTRYDSDQDCVVTLVRCQTMRSAIEAVDR